ncbi:unnamed protein product [Polarella glacialis]|uniref:Cyclin N-terminal domain-containing protein n=1 Tax=Polarella glacialis TaxID=89957 RepID=A0A813EG96_POLGL|nr:unnamed protein product [Polarella glacialis]
MELPMSADAALRVFASRVVSARSHVAANGATDDAEEVIEDHLFRFGVSSHQLEARLQMEATIQSKIQRNPEEFEPPQATVASTVPAGPAGLSNTSRTWALSWLRRSMALALPGQSGQECWFRMAAILDHLSGNSAEAANLGLVDGDHESLKVTSLAIASIVLKMDTIQRGGVDGVYWRLGVAGELKAQVSRRELEVLRVLDWWGAQQMQTVTSWAIMFRDRLSVLAVGDSSPSYFYLKMIHAAEFLVFTSRADAQLLPPHRLAGALLVLSFKDSGLLHLPSASAADDGLLEQLSWVIGADAQT